MAKAKFVIPLSAHFKNLYKPTVTNSQSWLAFIAFVGFIFTSLFRYSQQGWLVMEQEYSSFSIFMKIIIWIIAIVVSGALIYGLGSFICVVIRAFRKQKIQPESEWTISKSGESFKIDIHIETNNRKTIKDIQRTIESLLKDGDK